MSTIDDLLVASPKLLGRMVLREYDRETAEIGTSVNPERHKIAADTLRVVLAYFAGALSVFQPDDVMLGPDWLPTLRAYLEPKEDKA